MGFSWFLEYIYCCLRNKYGGHVNVLPPSSCNLRTLFKLSFESTIISCQGGIGSLSTIDCQNPNCFLSGCNRWIMLQPTEQKPFCSKGFSLTPVVFYIHVFISKLSSFHLTFITFLGRISFTTGVRKSLKVIESGNQWNIIILAWEQHMFHYKENIFSTNPRPMCSQSKKRNHVHVLILPPISRDIPVKCSSPSRNRKLVTSQGNLFPFLSYL